MNKIQIGQAPEIFDPEKTSWDEYMTTFEIFLEAAGIQDAEADRRRAIFLNYCGPEIRGIAQTLTDPQPARTVAWDVLQEKLASHFKPTKPAMVYRHQFSMMAQKENESINQFTTRLRTVLAQCKFKDPEARLTDALVFGMKSATVRNKLLTEEEPTLQTVIKLAQTAEAADAAARELKEHGRREIIAKIDAASPRAVGPDDPNQPAHNVDNCFLVQDQPRHHRTSHPAPCAGCRGNHQRHRCPFRDATCRRCNRRGHIAIACRATAPEETFAAPRYQRPQNQNPQPRENRPFHNSSQRNYSTANRDYYRDFETLPELRNTQIDLSGPGEPSSDAEPSSSSEFFVGPTRPSPPHGDLSNEPSSSGGIDNETELRRSERTARRPQRLDDFVTWLS
ncbi:uncharacterized protein [Erythrolamprus reginae]|uniref:uncharacterized protein n=1 Tax=Erythrolamprus reginae TaxID=121349 RepID=UPI00396C9138